MTTQLTYSHSSRSYWFRGRELQPPEPGTYDAAKWTPPTHQVFRVEIVDNGCWRIQLNGTEIRSGSDCHTASRANALALVQRRCALFLEG